MSSVQSSVINVVAGLIYQDGKLLVCQRRPDAAFPLKWEFPGGKIEGEESDAQALRRELREELEIEIGRVVLLDRNEHRYPGGPSVSLRFHRVCDFTGTVKNAVFERISWIALDDLGSLDFLDGDRPIIEKLLREREEFLLRA
jgi:8-oxo-dGTP diphosphatase